MKICFNAEIGIFFLESIVLKINDWTIVRYDRMKRNFDYYVKSSKVWLFIYLAILRKKISKESRSFKSLVIIQIRHHFILRLLLSKLIKDTPIDYNILHTDNYV